MVGESNEANDAADEQFVRRMNATQRQLRAFVLGLSPSATDADDLLQEVNLALWRKRHQYKPSHDFLKWACGFAALEMRSHRRKAARDRHWFSPETIELLTGEWENSSSFLDDCQRALATCLKKLGPAEKQVIESRYREQKSVKKIASETGRPLSTVYKVYSRALKLLRSCVKNETTQPA